MFGSFKIRKDVGACVQAISSLVAPAGVSGNPFGTVPLQIFGDAFVVGFIQSFLSFVMHESRGKIIKPAEQLRITTLALKHFIPDNAEEIIRMLPDLKSPNHQHYDNYITGARVGEEYVIALRYGNTVEVEQKILEFTNFIKQNYMDIDCGE